MNDLDHTISVLLDQHTPRAATKQLHPDWSDVMERAAAPQATPRRRRGAGWAPRALLVAAAGLLLLGGSALAGVGPGDALVHFVRGNQPAPKRVREGLQATFHWPNGLHVIAGESRSVIRYNGVTEWIAPVSSDRYCLGTIARDGSSQFSCDYAHPDAGIIAQQAGGSTRVSDGRIVGYTPPIVHGTAPAATTRVTLLFEDGTSRRLHISSAHFPNFVFFADTAPLSRAHLAAGHRPLALTARDASGRLLDVSHFTVTDFRPSNASDRTAEFHPIDVPGSASVSFGPAAPGRALTWVGRAVDGEVCLVTRNRWYDNTSPPVWIRAVDACGGPAGAVTAVVDRADTILFGSVPAGAAIMRVRFQDGTTMAARTDHGYWLLPLSPAMFTDGHRPSSVSADAIDGTRVATRRFNPAVDFSQK